MAVSNKRVTYYTSGGTTRSRDEKARRKAAKARAAKRRAAEKRKSTRTPSQGLGLGGVFSRIKRALD